MTETEHNDRVWGAGNWIDCQACNGAHHKDYHHPEYMVEICVRACERAGITLYPWQIDVLRAWASNPHPGNEKRPTAPGE